MKKNRQSQTINPLNYKGKTNYSSETKTKKKSLLVHSASLFSDFTELDSNKYSLEYTQTDKKRWDTIRDLGDLYWKIANQKWRLNEIESHIKALESELGSMKSTSGLMVFSLWTLRRQGLDKLGISRGRGFGFPIMLEVFGKNKADLTVEVWHRGKQIYSAKQLLSSSKEVRPKRSEKALKLFDSTVNKSKLNPRYFTHPDTGHKINIMICGEMNQIFGGGNSRMPSNIWGTDHKNNKDVVNDLADIVLNPSHTRFGPQAMRDKQKKLSQTYKVPVFSPCSIYRVTELNHYPNQESAKWAYNRLASNKTYSSGKLLEPTTKRGSTLVVKKLIE
jgi:hypothetical protein